MLIVSALTLLVSYLTFGSLRMYKICLCSIIGVGLALDSAEGVGNRLFFRLHGREVGVEQGTVESVLVITHLFVI